MGRREGYRDPRLAPWAYIMPPATRANFMNELMIDHTRRVIGCVMLFCPIWARAGFIAEPATSAEDEKFVEQETTTCVIGKVK